MKTIVTILVLTSFSFAVLADSREVDDTFFHPAASLYIRGNTTAASNLVAQGLAEFPKDGKLKRLKELLDQEQNQQQQNQDNKDQKQQDQQKKDQQNQEQQNNEKQQDQQQNQNNQQGNQDQQQDNQQSTQQPEQNIPEQMSPDEAKRLLDAMKQDEKNKRLLLHPVLGAPVKVDKDW